MNERPFERLNKVKSRAETPAKKHNQRELVLKYIADFGYITTWQAYQDLGISQLGARIKELKDIGYQFKTENVKTTNRYGKRTHYYKYYLVDKVS